ncbi:ABC transporter ATP-binding protein [Fusibacter bizertensis]|uniref:ABC transporter ATP-binding protein n=1 Tax=Fusibacter bizertensis TaxID=1488331 RepID=A0ABT6NH66_9FIRM|nr:ABC transporter ATP-binding protein [Fusibacter bizertensis]MDH8679764.1 ABC transporter ATP-binding protein [Fusibacter bizertensis]
MDILQIDGISKQFGTNKVIDRLSFSVKEGSIFGFIGQNGAGKTTTMKMILGLLKIDQGEIKVCGEKVTYGQNKTNQMIGYLPDVPEFYNYMKPKEYLKLCGEITGIPRTELDNKISELLNLVGLIGANKKIGGFSRGMKQRLGIAQALLNEPKLLICDEPTSALDPIGRKEILDILERVKGKTTVIFSTHILSDVERICDEIAVLHDGKVALTGTIAQLKARHSQEGLQIEFLTLNDREHFLNCISTFEKINQIKETKMGLTLFSEEIHLLQAKVFECIMAEHILPTKIEVLEPSIEHLFMEVVK